MKWTFDGLARLYLAAVVLALAASWPATLGVIAQFHAAGWAGLAVSTGVLILIEGGAIAAALASVSAAHGRRWLLGYKWAAIAAAGLANWLSGVSYGRANGLDGLSLYGGAALYAAVVSAVLALALHLLCERVRHLRGLPPVAVSERAAQQIAPLLQAALVVQETRRLLADQQLLALPAPQVQYERPVEARLVACAACGHVFESVAQRLAYAGHGCPGCGAKGKAVTTERA